MTLTSVISTNIHAIVAVFDAHDPGVIGGVHECPCGHTGTETEWEQHLAAKLGELLEPAEQLALV